MTYERVLKEIQKPNGDLTCRLLQCLVVAVWPLGVKELAKVLTVDFDDAEGIPKLKPNWRWEDQEKVLLTSCSSLITIVETQFSRVVQFSHFLVKEFLTSKRLATSSGDVSCYPIDLEPVHTIMAQACMGVLLQPDNCVEANDTGRRSPLVGYAAEHWVTHAQFERVSSFLRMAMEHLFDPDKPYFAAWVQLQQPQQPLVPLLVCSQLEIWYYSPLLCGIVWIPRSCRTPCRQVSTACEHQGRPLYDTALRSNGGKASSDSKASPLQWRRNECPRQ